MKEGKERNQEGESVRKKRLKNIKKWEGGKGTVKTKSKREREGQKRQ